MLLLSLAAQLTAASNESDAVPWRTDYRAARAEAVEAGLPLLLWFTGSDWCVWCRKLDAELFATSAFRAAAGRAFIPVMLDYPRRARIPIALQRQNRELAARFSVDTFPTVIWLDPASETELHRHGYLAVEPERYLESLRRFGK